ncbi:STAS domain-containing protein [Colwellia sp. MB02u-10]|jgi:anti-anti-sigma factor|uniref:STAS domain-containing protein n=1 Tax=Colwellia sp. MB02u-10 TaxID=2759828 RepID=UPI0015F74065|nr:STAS domain-containing protein [Colwellia sp. MB02u-10]MBA6341637.1 STAS domain-containing protein [Colwellia sp. MB02u-10]
MSFTKREESNQKKGICVLDASPDMTIYCAAKNLAEIKRYYAEFNHFELNLSDVEEIDSSGIQLLLALKQSATKDGKQVFLNAISNPVAEVMDVLNIRSNFDWIQPE